MAFQIVQCEVQFVACINYCDGSGMPNGKGETLGYFEDNGDACRALAEAGLTRKDAGWGWVGNYCYGTISRVLKEIK